MTNAGDRHGMTRMSMFDIGENTVLLALVLSVAQHCGCNDFLWLRLLLASSLCYIAAVVVTL